MIHSLLSSLPDLIDDHGDNQEETPAVKEEDRSEVMDNSFFPADSSLNLKVEAQEVEPNGELPSTPLLHNASDNQGDNADGSHQEQIDIPSIKQKEEPTPMDSEDVEVEREQLEPPPTSDEDAEPAGGVEQGAPLSPPQLDSSKHEDPASDSITAPVDPTTPDATKEEPPDALDPPPYPSLNPLSGDPNPDAAHPGRSKRAQIVLTDLLRQADDLYAKYPPSHPELALSSIMGPQSVVFTWSESFSGLPADDEAESMIAHPELVVYPFVEVEPHDKEQDSDAGPRRKKKGKERRRRTVRRLLSKTPVFGPVEKKTMLAGTVLVLGVAMAVYGMKASSSSSAASASGARWLLQGGHATANAKDWRRVGRWVGGALAGISQKILDVAAGHGP